MIELLCAVCAAVCRSVPGTQRGCVPTGCRKAPGTLPRCLHAAMEVEPPGFGTQNPGEWGFLL